MNKLRVLLVEDEILIADNIKRYLSKNGFDVIGIAINFEEAEQLYCSENPDIVLLDIKLSGSRTGIDFGHFIRERDPDKPFIYLTSQLDQHNIEKAKATLPSAYLAKPIQKDSLRATMEIVMHKLSAEQKEIKSIPLYDGAQNHIVAIQDILYIEADHVYLKVNLSNNKQVIHRNTLKDFLDQLPSTQFVQTHRSFVINVNKVDSWSISEIKIDKESIPISRSRKDAVLSLLKAS